MRGINSDCNCPIPCNRILFEPSLSYAALSEFNIDQVALTDTKTREAVRQRFLNTVETQQRVLKTIKETDNVTMTEIINTGDSLISSVTDIHQNSLDGTRLSQVYKVVDVLSGKFQGKADVTYMRVKFDELAAIRADSVAISFSNPRNDFEFLIDTLM